MKSDSYVGSKDPAATWALSAVCWLIFASHASRSRPGSVLARCSVPSAAARTWYAASTKAAHSASFKAGVGRGACEVAY